VEPGERPEWRRSARWHVDVSASSGFEQRERTYARTVESSDELARFAARHRPFYERLHAQRLDVAAWSPQPAPDPSTGDRRDSDVSARS
jgi:adenylylsulfate kinase